MLSKLFLGMSLVGAEWVLYLLLLLSVFSVAIIWERFRFYREASRGLENFRTTLRSITSEGKLDDAAKLAQTRGTLQAKVAPDLETEMAHAMLLHQNASPEVLTEIAQDVVVRTKLAWDRNLSFLATIGSNAPFIGLFGTVLGIIKAFHDLSQQGGSGPQAVISGISEALVATAIGLFVAIPAVVAFNLFQRRVKSAMAEAEALKCFLVGKLSQRNVSHGR